MNCKKCGKEHDGSFGSGQFCSRSCANARVWTDDINEKRSASVKKTIEQIPGWKESLSEPSRLEKTRKTLFKRNLDKFNAGLMHTGSNTLRKWLIETTGETCKMCGMGSEWNGKKLTLHTDHIDGDNKNNKPSNLRLLCPNCHSQTDTYAMQKDFIK